MGNRLAFAKLHRRNTWDNWVDLDEKWFYLWVNKGTLKLPPGYEQVKKCPQSRAHIPKVMFLSAIAKPDPARNFDGNIGIWRVYEPYAAKKTSKNYQKGQVYDKDVYMDAPKFRKMCTQKVFKAIREKMPWADKVTVQMDGASPHTGKDSVNVLNIAGRQCRHGGPIIEMLVQPSNSPDLNANDLGYFASMAARVNKCHVRDVDGIVKAVTQ